MRRARQYTLRVSEVVHLSKSHVYTSVRAPLFPRLGSATSRKSYRFHRVSAKSSARYAQSTLAQRSIEQKNVVVVVVVVALVVVVVLLLLLLADAVVVVVLVVVVVVVVVVVAVAVVLFLLVCCAGC